MVPPVRPRTPPRPAAEPERVLAGRTWSAGRLQPVEIGIDSQGRICAVGRTVRGGRRHDVGDRVVLPAAVDLHAHLREPGPADGSETIATGTVGAALAGVSLVGEMPNTDPPTTSVERLDQKESLARGRAAVDLLLYATPLDPQDVPDLARRAGGFKLFLSPTTGIERVPSDPELRALLARLAEAELPVVVHAEEPRQFREDPPATDPRSWDSARPVGAERAAVDRMLSAPARIRLHIAHVTSALTGGRIRDRGVSFEATAHHLLLSSSAGPDARWKVNPPLRSEAERAGLWASFAQGRVPVLASDHAPHPSDLKTRAFDRAPSGVPGIQSTVPLILARVASGDLSLPVFLQTACDRPARLLGQPLGRVSVGHRANLIVVDFREKRRLRGDRLASPCGWTPFEGAEVVFPSEHWRDGERVVDGGEYVGTATGRVVRPEYASGAPAGPASVGASR